jgi:hypothetical protein
MGPPRWIVRFCNGAQMEEGLMMRPSAQFHGRKESFYEDSVAGNGAKNRAE